VNSRADIRLKIRAADAQRYNEIASALVKEIKSPRIVSGTDTTQFQPDYHISGHITEADLAGEIEGVGFLDAYGNEDAWCFYVQGKPVGLGGQPYRQLADLVESIQRTPSFQVTVSHSLIRKHLFAWMKGSWLGSLRSTMTDYLISKCKSEIMTLEVWIPIAFLSVQSDLPIGNITIKPITKALLDKLYSQMIKGKKEYQNEITSFFEKKRKKLQGLSAGVISIIADPERAKEIAVEETNQAIALLRLFHPASMTPKTHCYCTMKGQENLETMTSFVFQDERFFAWNARVIDSGAQKWVISSNDIIEYRNDGLGAVSSLLKQGQSKFQENILDSLLLYSKVSLSRELSDKLVFLLVALESLLLKNKDERIQKNLFRRFATLIGTDATKAEIEQRIRNIYRIRSGFIHHAEKVKEVELLAEFMRDAWCVIMAVIHCKDTFQTKAEFISAIDANAETGA